MEADNTNDSTATFWRRLAWGAVEIALYYTATIFAVRLLTGKSVPLLTPVLNAITGTTYAQLMNTFVHSVGTAESFIYGGEVCLYFTLVLAFTLGVARGLIMLTKAVFADARAHPIGKGSLWRN